MGDLEIARYFIAMLYLAMKGKIEIVYEKPRDSHSNVDEKNAFSIDGSDFRNDEIWIFLK